jgi:hypothetical protein
MKNIHEEKLQEQREKLYLLMRSNKDLSSGEVLAGSQELDKLIVKVQKERLLEKCQHVKRT